jgi:hypothetical protein
LTNISFKKHKKIEYIRFALAGVPRISGLFELPEKIGTSAEYAIRRGGNALIFIS